MIDIAFEIRKGTLSLWVRGHAGAAPAGEDPVCAAASMLGYTAVQYASVLEQAGWLREKPEIRTEPGDLCLRFRPEPERLAAALNAMYVVELGFGVLAHNYPAYVRLRRTLAVSAKA